MQKQIYTYALIKCLFNKGEDYIDTFWPFIVNVLPHDKSGKTLEEIQNEIENNYKLKIPLHSLSIISSRAANKKYLNREARKCFITDIGLDYLSKLNSEHEESRRINELLNDAKGYLQKEHGINISIDETEEIIERIIGNNLELFEQFIDTKNEKTKPDRKFDVEKDAAIVEYLFFVEKTKPALFQTLQDIIIGSIISTIVYKTNFEEFDKKIENIQIFLDSNYLFSVLGLHYAENNKPAIELFQLMTLNKNIELKVFDFTIEEMNNVLKRYQTEQYAYPDGYKINSIYSSLKVQGWTAADVRELLVNIESKLWEKKIQIHSTNIDLDNYKTDEDRRSKLHIYKDDQGTREQNHDLAVIDLIKKLRKNEKKTLEKCTALFLTSDIKLAKYNFNECGHKNKLTIGEIIPDKILTNFLWLKSPNTDNQLHLSSWISIHTRYMFIDRTIWQMFYNTLKDMRLKEEITDLDISILIYDNQLQEVLLDMDPSDIHNIKTEWILKGITKAKERFEQSQDKKINDITLFFDEELKKSKKEAEYFEKEIQSKDLLLRTQQDEADKKYYDMEKRLKQLEYKDSIRQTKILESISDWKNQQEKSTEKSTDRFMLLITFIALTIIVTLSFTFYSFIFTQWGYLEPRIWFFTVLTTIVLYLLGITSKPSDLRLKLRDIVFNKKYQKNLKAIHEFEKKLELF